MNQTPQFLIGDDVFGFDPGQCVAIHLQDGKILLAAKVQQSDANALLGMEPEHALDLRGCLLLPGLVDAHVHAIATGMSMVCTMLDNAASLDEVEQAVRDEAGKGRRFVRLAGLDMSRLPQAEIARIDRKLLDNWVSGRPLFIKSVEGHSSWFNTKAWEQIGVEDYVTKCGVAEAEAAEMRRTGRVHGSAYESMTTPIYDSFTMEERLEGMRMVVERAKQVGLTGLHCLEGYGEYRREDFELMLELDGADGVDLVLYCRDSTPQLAHELGVTRFGGCWCLDGAIGAHSAALSEPYVDKPESRGELYFSDEEITGWLDSALALGMQPCVHAIGDRALAQAVRVLKGLADRHDLQHVRPRVEHFVLGDAGLAAEAAAAGITGAMQPAFDARWGGIAGGYATRLGPERALNSNPVGTLRRAGLPVAGSSDSYITPLDPLGGIRAAMNHHNPEHQVGFEEAVELFSCDAAYLCHREQETGRIAPGYAADFTIVEGGRNLEDARIAGTIKDGIHLAASRG